MVLGLKALFRERPTAAAGKALYGRAVAQARNPEFYVELGAPDTPEGRFEIYTLHVLLLVLRLKGRGQVANETVQALFDAYVESLDIALRELGVGHNSVGKKMKKLGRAFYGRVSNWEKALGAGDDLAPLVARTVYEGQPQADPGPVVAYAIAVRALLSEQSDERLLAGEVEWPKVIP